jgi:transcriptional regulator with XRE-family HTH domain
VAVENYAMPISLPKPDPEEFAKRLNETLDARGYEPGRGRGKKLATLFDVSQPVASAWLNGKHMPSADKVLAMSEHWKVPFEWLYFNRGELPSAIARFRGLVDPDAPVTPEQAIERLRGDMLAVRSALLAFAGAVNSKLPGVAGAFLENFRQTARDPYYAERGFHGLLEGALEQIAGSGAEEQPAALAGPALAASQK